MRKDYILTPEEKQTKKQRLEENRLLRSTLINNNIRSESITEPRTSQNLQSVRQNLNLFHLKNKNYL
jgi:hypothetical protein